MKTSLIALALVFEFGAPAIAADNNCEKRVLLTGTIVNTTNNNVPALAITSNTPLCMEGDGGERTILLKGAINRNKWFGRNVIIEGELVSRKVSIEGDYSFIISVKRIVAAEVE
jgi:hypothetical protein